MGLDLSVTKNLKYIGAEDDFDNDVLDEMYNNAIYLYNIDVPFLKQSDGLKSGFYSGDYAITEIDLHWSYGGYNSWRQHLIQFAGYENMEDIVSKYNMSNRHNKIVDVLGEGELDNRLKFAELCYFSDCEGFIGHKTSHKLYNDFIENLDSYIDCINSYDDYEGINKENYIKSYKGFIEYFKIASENNGAVVFH